MKIAQMSDLHYCAKNLVESDRCFGASVTEAILAGVDAAIITGDSTDHAMDAHAPAVIALARQLKRLADHCPVLMLQGTFSHEPPGLLRMFELIGACHPITIADRIASFGLEEGSFEPIVAGKDYRLAVHALPTLNKADIAALTPQAVGEAGRQVGDLISQILDAFACANRSLLKQGVPTMVISHGTVLNCLTEHGVPMAGTDHEFALGTLFSAEADVVALGHIHKHQVWRNQDAQVSGRRKIVAYAGSIGRFHHGEEGDKVWIEWDMTSGDPGFAAHPTPSRRTVDLFFDGPPDMEKIRELSASLAGLFVRVRYQVDEEHRQRVDREAIKALLAGAADVQIEGKTLIVERVRAAGISTANSLSEKLQKWCEATVTPGDGLQSRLSDLQSKTGEMIVVDIMDRMHGREPIAPVPLPNVDAASEAEVLVAVPDRLPDAMDLEPPGSPAGHLVDELQESLFA